MAVGEIVDRAPSSSLMHRSNLATSAQRCPLAPHVACHRGVGRRLAAPGCTHRKPLRRDRNARPPRSALRAADDKSRRAELISINRNRAPRLFPRKFRERRDRALDTLRSAIALFRRDRRIGARQLGIASEMVFHRSAIGLAECLPSPVEKRRPHKPTKLRSHSRTFVLDRYRPSPS